MTSDSKEREDPRQVKQVVGGGSECSFPFWAPERARVLSEGRARVAEVARSAGRSRKGPAADRTARAPTARSPSPGPPRFASPFPKPLHSRGRVVCAVRRGPPGSPRPSSLVRAPGSGPTVSRQLLVKKVFKNGWGIFRS